MDLLLTGRLIEADEAQSIGMINRVVPAADVLADAIVTAKTIAANSPPAVQAVKRQIANMISDDAVAQEPNEQILGDIVRDSPEFQEGVAAFLGKRQPDYG
jgi:enoyl-CoA hydratase/carnithine racemase